jgi:hypothetical protein
MDGHPGEQVTDGGARVVAKFLAEYVNLGQPISHRPDHTMSGIRSQIAVKLYGRDIEELRDRGQDIAEMMTSIPGVVDLQIEPQVDIPQVRVTVRRREDARYGLAPADVAKALETALQGRTVSRVPGATEVRAQQIAGLPNLRIRVNRKAIARYDINVADVLGAVETIGVHQVGQVLEGQPRFVLQVRLAPSWREDLDRLRQIKIADPQGRQIPLGQLADLTLEEGPAKITRDAIRRRLLIEANVRGRDLAGFVADAQTALKRDVKLPPGYLDPADPGRPARHLDAALGTVCLRWVAHDYRRRGTISGAAAWAVWVAYLFHSAPAIYAAWMSMWRLPVNLAVAVALGGSALLAGRRYCAAPLWRADRYDVCRGSKRTVSKPDSRQGGGTCLCHGAVMDRHVVSPDPGLAVVTFLPLDGMLQRGKLLTARNAVPTQRRYW